MAPTFSGLTNEQLLAEVEDVIRTMPPRATIRHESDENFEWCGRAVSVLHHWNLPYGIEAASAVHGMQARGALEGRTGFMRLMLLLRQAQSDLRMKTVGPVNVAVGQGEVFRYFDVVRQILELAKDDLLFVDRYMGAEFVAKYCRTSLMELRSNSLVATRCRL